MKLKLKRRQLFLLLKVIIGLGLMVVLLRFVDYENIAEALRNPRRPVYLLIALILLVPNLILQLVRWHFLLRRLYPQMPLSESLASLFGGMVIGFMTPGRIGEMGRALFLKRVDPLKAVGLVFLDKLYSFTMILIAGFWGLIFIVIYTSDFAPFLAWPLIIAGLIISVTAILILLHPEWIRSLLYQISLLFPVRDKLKRILESIGSLSHDHSRIFLLLSFLMYAIYILQFCILAAAFQNVPWYAALSASTATIVTKTLIPISLADLGVREGASIYFFLLFNVDKVTAFNSSILLFAINVLLPACVGIFFLPRLGWKDLKTTNT